MELKDIVKTVAAIAVIGVVTYAFVKDIQRGGTAIRIGAEPEGDPFWDSCTERDRIQALREALRSETDPEVRRELAKQLGRQEAVAA